MNKLIFSGSTNYIFLHKNQAGKFLFSHKTKPDKNAHI